jgi:hypothetical protein
MQSILMDENTFDQFPNFRSDAPADLAQPPHGLREFEHSLFLRLARLSSRNRLEQERLPAWWTANQFSLTLEA